MRIKNWKKSKKYDGTNPMRHTIWTNTLPQYDTFGTAYYITVQGSGKNYSVNVTKSCKQTLLKSLLYNNGFTAYEKARKFAIKYMKAHPRG